ncbi:Crp/Fnr family transcriptional regulator [Ramlibacter humi]|nr:Crp/Fnr family transcriptional regulator [Ramlibacter humi]
MLVSTLARDPRGRLPGNCRPENCAIGRRFDQRPIVREVAHGPPLRMKRMGARPHLLRPSHRGARMRLAHQTKSNCRGAHHARRFASQCLEELLLQGGNGRETPVPTKPTGDEDALHCNRLLQGLPSALHAALRSVTELVVLSAGSMLGAGAREANSVYFPLRALAVLLHTDDQGSSSQTGIVGSDGMIGLTGWFGRQHSEKALVLAGGLALRFDADQLQRLFDESAPLRRVLMGYSAELTMQAAQMALCGRHHSPERQLCSLLLLLFERGAGEDLSMTHELAARMIGVRRETISQAAMRLQQQGYIRCSRGHFRILDRDGLEKVSCGCHRSAPLRPHGLFTG